MKKLFFLFSFFFPHYCLAQCNNFQDALKIASEIRKLEILAPVNCKVVSEKEFSKKIQKTNAIDAQKLEFEGKINKMIGLVPQSYDYAKCYLEDDLESVMASYIPEDKTVYIPVNKKSTLDLLVHEATHALQDQHFNLLKLSKLTSTNIDSYYAFLAIAEGDAELVQNKYLASINTPKKSAEQKDKREHKVNSCNIPQALLFQLDFPYFWGMRYVKTLENINDSFKNYPKFTTEILYPQKKFKFKQPTESELLNFTKKHIKKQFKISASDSLGEYTLRCILRELIGSRFSVLAGYGWRGDLIQLYRVKDSFALSWLINTESKHDARELFSALKKTIEVRFNIKLKTNSDTVVYGNETYKQVYLHLEEKQIKLFMSEELQ